MAKAQPQSAKPKRLPNRRWILLCAVLGTLGAHGAAIFGLEPEGLPLESSADGLWPGVGALLLSLPHPSSSPFLFRLLELSCIVLAGVLTAGLARRVGLSAPTASLAALLCSVSPFLGSTFLDPAGRGYLLALLAWLGGLVLEPVDPQQRRTASVLTLQGVLFFLSVWLSQGVFLPCTFLWLLLIFTRGRRPPRPARSFLAVALMLICLPLLFLRSSLPDVGYGFQLHEGLSSFQGQAPQPGPPFLAGLLASLGIGGQLPLLLPGWVFPAFSHLLGGLLVLLLLLLPTPAEHCRRLALRFGGMALILASFGVVLLANLSSASALPAAALMPAAPGLAVLLASFLEPGRRGSPRKGLVIAGVGCVVLLLESIHLETTPIVDHLLRAKERDSSVAYVAVSLSELGQRRNGEPHLEPLQSMILRSPRSLLPVDLELKVGLRVAHDLEHSAGVAAALAWVQQWLTRVAGRPQQPYAALHAQRIFLLLRDQQVQSALSLLSQERVLFDGDVVYEERVARAVLDALATSDLSSSDQQLLVSVAEEFLDRATRIEGASGVRALLSLAELRMGQFEFIEAVKLAEEASRRAPRDARPLVLMARLYMSLGQNEDGLRKVAQAIQRDAEDPGARFLQGRLYSLKASTAEHGVRQMLEAYLEDSSAASNLTELVEGIQTAMKGLTGAGKLDVAEALLRQALAKIPARSELLVELARVQRQRGMLDAALLSLEDVLRVDSLHQAAKQEAAEILRDQGYKALIQGQRADAVQAFRKVIDLAVEGMDTGGMKAVVQSFENPGNQGVSGSQEDSGQIARESFDRGIVQYREGDLELALKSFEESLQHLISNPLAHLNVGRIQLELGRAIEAEEPLRLALALGESLQIDVEQGYLLLTRSLLQQERKPDARQVAIEYRQKHPGGDYDETIHALLELQREN